MSRIAITVIVLVALAVGFVAGQAVPLGQAAVVQPAPVAASVPAVVDTGKLTPFERGQLVTQCYQAAGVGGVPSSAGAAAFPKLLLEGCLKNVHELP